MISRSILFILLCLTCILTTQAQTVKSLIKKNLKARGGIKSMSAVRNVKISQEQTMRGIVSHSLYYAENPNKFRFDQLQNGKVTFTLVNNGSKGWMKGPTGKPTPVSEKDAAYASEADGNPLGPLFQFKERGYTIEYLGQDTLQGADVYKLKVKMNAMEQTMYLDAITYLEKKIDRGVMNYGKESSYIQWLEDYRPVNGVLFPHRVRAFPQGQPPYQIKRTSIEVNVDSKGLFDEPADK